MKIRELIKNLQNYDPEFEIVVSSPACIIQEPTGQIYLNRCLRSGRYFVRLVTNDKDG